jgi:AGZA family xanthine/uracil permease-like MFS transporter
VIDRLFGLAAHRTNVRTEVVAGITTFLAMA